MVSYACPDDGRMENVMAEKTCVAFDCELDPNRMGVGIGGRGVEVCRNECAHKRRETDERL